MEYYFENRAVAFLDVLGFKEKLKEFEVEALNCHQSLDTANEESNIDEMISPKANDFISTFLDAISVLDKERFSYYMFSDNICITVNTGNDKSLLIELLLVISDLYFAFAKKGFFLRGGIDYGYFINFDSMAVGKPLANAYEIEQNKAMYPRIVISENFKKVFDQNNGETANQKFIHSLILKSCEVLYLNVFLNVLKTDKKIEYFNQMKAAIVKSLEENINCEKVFLKYEWLANEFNCFIDSYRSLVFADDENEPDEDFLLQLSNLNIPIICQQN